MSLPVGSAGGWALWVEGCVGGLLVLRCGNDVIMSTLIPLETGIHVRQTSTQISPPSHPSNCWDYVWQWRRVGGHVHVLQLNTHTHTHRNTHTLPPLSSVQEKLSRAALGSRMGSGWIDHSLQTCVQGSNMQHSGMKSCKVTHAFLVSSLSPNMSSFLIMSTTKMIHVSIF